MAGIAESITSLRATLGPAVTLVAVSKTKGPAEIMTAYNCGQRDFGENKAQEMVKKSEELPKDIRWHFVGHLQSNKVKFVVPVAHLIHSVDSAELLREISKRAEKAGRRVDCLLQLSIAEEESKYGFEEEELKTLYKGNFMLEVPFVRIRGMMGMASLTDDRDKIRSEFRRLSNVFREIRATNTNAEFDTLSMGMTGDFDIALEEGSTMVRIGSLIFGERT